ncbi:hypothetical protein [Glycomyces tritici]|uniref:Uncharacterized protein n=1 Tax=Glycomyces tritici TaxID=2665176 RepID=A0ABT7YNL4_9ACTN|nr:hypothetical protein [Glycomyces tritici]MDN3239989.1 hypothetical protein [Glycomyces tritici]
MKVIVQPVAADLDEIVLDLNDRRYALIRSKANKHALTEAAVQFGARVSAAWVGVRALEAHGSQEWLPRHTKQLEDPEPLRYFALGCVAASASGGATCLYGGRIAARAPLKSRPEPAQVRMAYSTKWRPTSEAHPRSSKIHGIG